MSKRENGGKQRSGIMCYFEILDLLYLLSYDEIGRLFIAMLEYAHEGKMPEFIGLLAMAWASIRHDIDRDGEKYADKILKSQYGGFKKVLMDRGGPMVSYDEWLAMSAEQRQEVLARASTRYPTTAATTSTITTSSTSAAKAATDMPADTAQVAAETDCDVVDISSSDGHGVVHMLRTDANDLVDKLGQKRVQHYIDRICAYVAKTNAHIKNPHDMILKWALQDCTAGVEITRQQPGNRQLDDDEIAAIRRMMADE